MVGENFEIYTTEMAKMNLKSSPWLEKILKLTLLKQVKMHGNTVFVKMVQE